MFHFPYYHTEALGDLSRLGARQGSIVDQHFGMGVLDDDIVLHHSVPRRSCYRRPWRHLATRHSGMSAIQDDKDGFKIKLDVQQFKPDEVTVKLVDNYIVVDGKHEEREDEHGHITRQFQRRYRIPDDVDPDTIVSKLSSDSVLSIEAPKKTLPPPSKERVVEIVRTNATALPVKKSSENKEQEDIKQ